jgi:hypothetical protein
MPDAAVITLLVNPDARAKDADAEFAAVSSEAQKLGIKVELAEARATGGRRVCGGFIARISIDADFAAEADEFQAARTQAGRPSSSMRLSALTAILTSRRRRDSPLERKASQITRL